MALPFSARLGGGAGAPISWPHPPCASAQFSSHSPRNWQPLSAAISAAGATTIFPRILAIVHVLVGLACSAIALPFIGLFLTDPGATPAYRSAGGIFMLLFAIYFAPSVVGGIGLLFKANWARTLLLVQAFAYLFLIPLGTALGIATLLVLLGGQRPSNATMDQSGEPLPQPQPGALQRALNRPLNGPTSIIACMAIVGPGFIVGIAALYHINEPRTPPELDIAALIALPIMLVAIVVLIRSIRMADGAAPHWQDIDLFSVRRRRSQRESRLLTEEEHRRVRRLAADPVRRKYALLIRQGQHWNDDQIAYDLDPTRLVTCPHIQPIERAMRDAGILVRPSYGVIVDAACCVDGPRLRRQFDIHLPVWFSDTIQGDRPYDPEGAAIMCREHGSGIWLIHPDEAKPDTPRFPPNHP